MARIALDAMGGDYAPGATVRGALLALSELDGDHRIQLVGQTSTIEREIDALLRGELAGLSPQRERLDIIDAPDVIGMADKPVAAVRAKPNSSMVAGIRLQADGASDAFVSAGNTGAQMAASMMLLKLHPGLDRPAIATIFPTARRPVVVLDSGANVDCSTRELVQFARLGASYAEDVLGRADPVVGLLNIGEEAEKGNTVVKDAHRLLQSAGLRFHGNVEGRDVAAGESDRGPFDVVVCDGFVGNIVLKFYEAIAPMIVQRVAATLGAGDGEMEDALKGLDYTESGGAPLLGVRGVSIISHGKSSPRALKNAIRVAARAADSRLNEDIAHRLAEPVPEVS